MTNSSSLHLEMKMACKRGFTLIEMAVALFVITLLLSSILVPLQTQVAQRQISATDKMLLEIREALIGYALAHGYLPCPAISVTNGAEDRDGNACNAGKRAGYLPWETLGVSRLDAWGHIYRYSVTPAFASSASPTFSLVISPDITIQTRNIAGSLINLTNANSAAAVVLSHGRNGYGSVDAEGVVQALPSNWPASNTDENTNAQGTTTFVSRVNQDAGATGTGGEFDDIVTWIPRYVLLNRMVSAGKLP